jgi:hypothetical protein
MHSPRKESPSQFRTALDGLQAKGLLTPAPDGSETFVPRRDVASMNLEANPFKRLARGVQERLGKANVVVSKISQAFKKMGERVRETFGTSESRPVSVPDRDAELRRARAQRQPQREQSQQLMRKADFGPSRSQVRAALGKPVGEIQQLQQPSEPQWPEPARSPKPAADRNRQSPERRPEPPTKFTGRASVPEANRAAPTRLAQQPPVNQSSSGRRAGAGQTLPTPSTASPWAQLKGPKQAPLTGDAKLGDELSKLAEKMKRTTTPEVKRETVAAFTQKLFEDPKATQRWMQGKAAHVDPKDPAGTKQRHQDFKSQHETVSEALQSPDVQKSVASYVKWADRFKNSEKSDVVAKLADAKQLVGSKPFQDMSGGVGLGEMNRTTTTSRRPPQSVGQQL